MNPGTLVFAAGRAFFPGSRAKNQAKFPAARNVLFLNRFGLIFPRAFLMNLLTCLLILSTGLFASTGVVSAQSQSSAREALGIISAQFGPRATQWVAELRAKGGVPQPFEWDVVAFDDRAPRLLYRFSVAGGRAADQGVDRQFYPDYAPAGYFSANQIVVDSVAAFTIAEGEARKAKMAFDSCDYVLRVRDFSTEPIWRLDLLDVRRAVVGKIYLSANSGEVLRTIWIYRDPRTRSDGEPMIIDSFAPTQRSLTTGITGSDVPTRAPYPGEGTGIVQTTPPAFPPTMYPTPGESGIAGIPAPPVPGATGPAAPGISPVPQMSPPPVSSAPPAAGPPLYRPVDPNGRVMTDPGGIPDPPAVSPPASVSPPATTTPPSTGGMADLREAPAATRPDPTRPPIEVPAGTGGSSERIPPPPIPR